jgi:hypothetical protein
VRLPGIKSLEKVFGGDAPRARELLRASRADLLTTPEGAARDRECYRPPATEDLRMTVLDALADTSGVEAVETKKGMCEYLNAGDAYAPTLIFFNGTYRVGCWGDVVERHGFGGW